VYFTQRSVEQLARFNHENKAPAAISTRDVLEFATLRGAECCALEGKCGTLTPGKEADLLLMRTDNFRHYPVNNVFGAIVQAGGTGSLDTVFIEGRAKNFRGTLESKLVGHDL